MRNTVKYSPPARCYLDSLPARIADYLKRSIEEMAQEPMVSRMMVVQSWSRKFGRCFQAFKMYAYSPGYRAIFHREPPNIVYIDRIARRDQDPYGDGG